MHRCSKSSREIANKTYEEVEKRRTDNCLILKRSDPGKEEAQRKWKEFVELDNQIAVKHFKKIDKQLFEIRIVLIPRALTLSNSRELSDALHRFEDILRSYENILAVNTERATTSNLRDILLEACKVYDALMKEHQKEMS